MQTLGKVERYLMCKSSRFDYDSVANNLNEMILNASRCITIYRGVWHPELSSSNQTTSFQ